jgi:small-conductance mechanosensitive channel
MSIIMSKTFEIGDTIRIKGIEGIVEEINLNYTKIMDVEGKVIYMPNRTINMECLENLTRRRFYLYTYKVPFRKGSGDPDKIRDTLMFIEGKIGEYAPIEIEIKTEIPNANDFVYVFEVKVPEENDDFDKEIREFLIPYIFPKA